MIRRQLGIDHSVFGRLFASERWPSGVQLSRARFDGLAIEGELAVRLARDLPAGDLSDAALFDAIESAFAVIELHNMVFRRSEPTAAELIANNAIHAGFVVTSSPSSKLDHAPAELRIAIDDVEVAGVNGVALTDTILGSLRWLAHELGRRGVVLLAGQTILCGSVADLIPVSSGSRIAVTTDRFGSVECVLEDADKRL